VRWLAFVLVACSSEKTEPPSALRPDQAPRFDACAEDQLPTLGGGCATIGGSAPTVREPVEKCPEDKFGDPKADNTLYVDAAFTGTSTGKRDAPYRTIGEATTAAIGSPTIAIADGIYNEDVYTRGARIWGRCASKVTIKGVSSTAGAIELGGDATVHGVTVTGPGWGIVLYDAAIATIESSVIKNTARPGIEVDAEKNPTKARILDTIIEGTGEEGVYADGGEVSIERSVIRDIKPYKGKSGIGVRAELGTVTMKPARALVIDSLIERATEAGVAANGSSVSITGSIIRNTSVRVDSGLGVGVYAEKGQLEIIGSLIEQNHRANIYLVESTARVELSSIRGALSRPDTKQFGNGVEARLGSELTLQKCTVENNLSTGVVVRGAKAIILDTIVRNTKGNESDGREGFGIAAWLDSPTATPATLDVTRSLIASNKSVGIALGGATGTISDVVVRNTVAASDGFGDGIVVGAAVTADGTVVDATASVTRVLLEKNARSGAVAASASLRIRDAALRCNAIDLEVSSRIGSRGFVRDVEKQFTLVDEGNVACGCDTVTRCIARAESLRTVASPTEGE
jgi:hypothetical protein